MSEYKRFNIWVPNEDELFNVMRCFRRKIIILIKEFRKLKNSELIKFAGIILIKIERKLYPFFTCIATRSISLQRNVLHFYVKRRNVKQFF